MDFKKDGLIIINKPKGITSYGVIRKLKRVFSTHKIGHGGSLDPMASGVLPILLNKATRLARFFLSGWKEYIGTVCFGFSTDTYDIEGDRTTEPVFDLNFDILSIEKWLNNFKGKIMQTPPIYSSVKIKGKSSHYYARKGQKIVLKPREVNIGSIEILQWSPPNLTLKIECSGGTYIRSIAHDLGVLAGCGAHLSKLHRTRVGKFSLEQGIKLERLLNNPELIDNFFVPIDFLLEWMDFVVCPKNLEEKVKNGNTISIAVKKDLSAGKELRILDQGNKLLALGKVVDFQNGKLVVHPEIVFK